MLLFLFKASRNITPRLAANSNQMKSIFFLVGAAGLEPANKNHRVRWRLRAVRHFAPAFVSGDYFPPPHCVYQFRASTNSATPPFLTRARVCIMARAVVHSVHTFMLILHRHKISNQISLNFRRAVAQRPLVNLMKSDNLKGRAATPPNLWPLCRSLNRQIPPSHIPFAASQAQQNRPSASLPFHRPALASYCKASL